MDNKRQQADRLEERSADPAIWNDPQAAKAVMRDLSGLRDQVSTWDKLAQDVADALSLLEMAADDGDESIMAEVETGGRTRLRQRFDRLAFQLAFSGNYDRNDAILSIHAGAGGTEAQDWASMLLRMFLRWAERHGYDTEITNQLEGEEAGIKTVTLEARALGLWLLIARRAACTGSCASAPSIRPRAATPPLPWSKCCLCWTMTSRLT